MNPPQPLVTCGDNRIGTKMTTEMTTEKCPYCGSDVQLPYTVVFKCGTIKDGDAFEKRTQNLAG